MRLKALHHLNPRMLSAFAAAWLALGILLSAGLVRDVMEKAREAFETDARIAHRLMSQRAVQHEAILAMLQLLQPQAEQDVGMRLAAVYPQVLAVHLVRPGELSGSETLGGHLPHVDWGNGRFWLKSAPTPSGAEYALEISLPLMVPWAEWPFGNTAETSTAEVALEGGARGKWLAQKYSSNGALRTFEFRKFLAATSQPFELVIVRAYHWNDIPWLRLLLLWLAWATVAIIGLTLWRQADAKRRAETLLRLGQVSRLNSLGELAAGLAHELNQPLTAVLAGTQASRRLLNDVPPEIEVVSEAMQQVEAQARRAADVVARLRRAIDRPGAQELLPVDLAEVARQVMQLMAPEFRQRGVAVLLPETSAWACADRVAVEQIVLNLASNALHALSEIDMPQIVFSVKNEGDQAKLFVRDNGPGLPLNVLEHLFEPFVSSRQGGLGLGLSLCETLALEMNGVLKHEAPASGTGAVFILELPAAKPVQDVSA